MQQNSLFQSIPEFIGHHALFNNVFYYAKNIDSEYIDCNEKTAAALNLVSLNDIKGKNDQSFGWSKERVAFLRAHDIEIMKTHSTVCKIEKPFILANGQRIQLISYKFPLITNETLLGVAGISIEINPTQLNNTFSQENLLSQIQHNEQHEYSMLSYRQKQCLHYLAKGMTMKQIAHRLDISPRTVEHHLESIKEKLQCATKAELISKVNANSEIPCIASCCFSA